MLKKWGVLSAAGGLVLATVILLSRQSLVDQVISQAQKGATEQALIETINQHKGSYSVTAEQVLKLKQNNVPEKVVVAMLQNSRKQ